MAAFAYRAVDAKGRSAKGIVEASSSAAARQALRAQKLLPVSVEPTAARRAPGAGAARQGRGGIGLRTLTLVTRQLATLIGSGIRVEDALRTVAAQAGSTRASSLLLNLRAAVLDDLSVLQHQHPVAQVGNLHQGL